MGNAGPSGLLVLRPGALGDTLLAVPALRALRRPFGPITLAAHPAAARLLAAADEVDTGLAFDDPSLAWLFRGPPRDQPVVAWMNPAGALGLQSALLAVPSRPAGEQHVARYLLETLLPLGIDLTFDDRPLSRVSWRAPTASECNAGQDQRIEDELTPGSNDGADRRLDEILVHPGSGSAAKNWAAAKVAQTIRCIDGPLRLIVGEADARAALEVEACLGRPLPRLEHPSLMELAARLAVCRAYLGNDSGVSHLAGLCGARTVVIFGPTSPEMWRPLGPHIQVARFDACPEDIARMLLSGTPGPVGDTSRAQFMPTE